MRRMQISPLTVAAVTLFAVFFLWESVLLAPLKLFVVLLHEISHGLAAVLTGGSLERLQLFANEGGAALIRGGNPVVILSAGYLGSSLWGAAMLRLAVARTQVRGRLLAGMGVGLGLIALLYARDPFTFGYVALSAAVLLLLGLRVSAGWQSWLLFIIGTVSCLYAVVDIGTDVLAGGPLVWLFGPRRLNDAEMLARLTRIPAFVWGILWIGSAVLIYLRTAFHVGRCSRGAGPGRPSRSAAQARLDEIDRL